MNTCIHEQGTSPTGLEDYPDLGTTFVYGTFVVRRQGPRGVGEETRTGGPLCKSRGIYDVIQPWDQGTLPERVRSGTGTPFEGWTQTRGSQKTSVSPWVNHVFNYRKQN